MVEKDEKRVLVCVDVRDDDESVVVDGGPDRA